MYRLLEFLRKIHVLLIFILLECVAIHFYANSTPYTRARLLSASNAVVGTIYRAAAGVRCYFGLGRENRHLTEEIIRLRNELDIYRLAFEEKQLQALRDTVISPYDYLPARVVHNSIGRQENFLTLNKGMRDGVRENMAVLTPNGAMVGYVLSCSDRYAVCISLLNTSFRASGRLASSDHFGSISWPGIDSRRIRLSEIPKYAHVIPGDTILTTDYSFSFPSGIPIGRVVDYKSVEETASYDISVEPFADFSTLKEVILVGNDDSYERMMLENETIGPDR